MTKEAVEVIASMQKRIDVYEMFITYLFLLTKGQEMVCPSFEDDFCNMVEIIANYIRGTKHAI